MNQPPITDKYKTIGGRKFTEVDFQEVLDATMDIQSVNLLITFLETFDYAYPAKVYGVTEATIANRLYTVIAAYEMRLRQQASPDGVIDSTPIEEIKAKLTEEEFEKKFEGEI